MEYNISDEILSMSIVKYANIDDNSNYAKLLRKIFVNTVGDLIQLTEEELMTYRGINKNNRQLIIDLRSKLLEENGVKTKNCINDQFKRLDVSEIILRIVTLEKAETISREDLENYVILRSELERRQVCLSDEIEDVLHQIPVSLCISKGLITNKRILTVLEALNAFYLSDLYDIRRDHVAKVPTAGNRTWTDIVKIKEDIRNNAEKYKSIYKIYGLVKELPILNEEISSDITIAQKIDITLQQLQYVLELQEESKFSKLIKDYFLDGNSVKDLASIYNCSTTSVENYINTFINDFFSGSNTTLGSNVFVSQSLIDEINDVSEKITLAKLQDAVKIVGAKDQFQLIRQKDFYDIDIIEKKNNAYIDADIVISSTFQKKEITMAIHSIHGILNKQVIPMTVDSLLEKVSEQSKYDERWDGIIEAYLKQCSWVEWSADKLFYSYNKLSRAEDRIARIIYVRRNEDIKEVTVEELRTYPGEGRSFANSASKAADAYDWIRCVKDGVYEYCEGFQKIGLDFRKEIKSYAEKHIEFRLSDMIEHFQSKNMFMHHKASSFRTIVLKTCRSNKKDRDLFRLSSMIRPTDNNWRNQHQNGITNWIIVTIVDIFKSSSREKFSIETLFKIVTEKAINESYTVNRSFFYATINKYSCLKEENDELFYNENNELSINDTVLENSDLERIGYNNKRPAYYMEVITRIVEKLKDAEDTNYTLKLATLFKLCRDVIEGNAQSNVFYKIIKSQLPEEIERYEKDGIQYLRYFPGKQVIEEYKIEENQDSDFIKEEPAVVKVDTQKPLLNSREQINLNNLCIMMKDELGYYNRFWDIKNTNLEESVNKLVDFIKISTNGQLSRMLLRSLFSFFCCKNDKFDLYHQLTDLILSYEAFVREIYKQKTGITAIGTDGLKESVILLDDMYNWAYTNYNDYGFARIFKKLKYKRNQRSHGETMGQTSVDLTQSIVEFAALYAYTLARFGN